MPSALAQVVLAPTVFHRSGLPASAIEAPTVTCPRGYVAASGGVSAAAPGVALLRAEPAGSRAYAFRLGNSTGNARRVTVSVACRTLRTRAGPGADIELKQLKPKSLQVAPGAQRSAALVCPAGTVPAGSGIDLTPGGRGQSAGFGGTKLSVRRITASLRSFSFAVRNSGGSARRVALSGNCITVVSRPGAPRQLLRVKVITFRGSVDTGRHSIGRSCQRGWFSLAAGYSLPAPSLAVEGAAAVGGSGTWSVVNGGGDSTRVVLQLVCGRLAR